MQKKIWDEDFGERQKSNYLNKIWENGDDNILRLFFGKKLYFRRMIDIELTKLSDPEIYGLQENNITYGTKDLTKLTLYEIRKINPQLEQNLREETFNKARVDGGYKCAICGKIFSDKRFLQVDHIKALNNGGLTVPENLQILCCSCNAKKSDSV